jgi:hypothetical protein
MCKSIWWGVLTACLAVLCFAGDHSDGILKGMVTDPAGAVVADVPIRIQHWERDQLGHPALIEDTLLKTGRSGDYSVSLPAGVYEVFLTFPSFSPVARRIRVEAGKTVEVTFKLKFDPTTKFVE